MVEVASAVAPLVGAWVAEVASVVAPLVGAWVAEVAAMERVVTMVEWEMVREVLTEAVQRGGVKVELTGQGSRMKVKVVLTAAAEGAPAVALTGGVALSVNALRCLAQ